MYKKIKGVKKSVIKKLNHEDYIECMKYKKNFMDPSELFEVGRTSSVLKL